MKQVRVAPGYSAVPLLGRLWNQGTLLNLTDAQYAQLPPFVLQQLVVVASAPDPAGGVQPTGPITSYTDELMSVELSKMGVPIFLVWDGTDYQPDNLKGAIGRPKTFIGPTDPQGVSGVNLAQRDQWINN